MNYIYPITIVLPTYNRLNNLKSYLKYYLKLPVNEVLIIDDGSTDETESYILSLNNPKLSYYKHEKNMGLPTARNSGVRHAKSDYIIMGEDDVIFTKNYIFNLFDYISNNDIDFIAGKLINVISKNRLLSAYHISKKNYSNLFAKGYIFADYSVNYSFGTPFLHACSLFKKNIALQYPFDESFTGRCLREESNFYLKLHSNGYKGYLLHNAVAFHLKYGISGGCKTSSIKSFLSYVKNEHKFLSNHWDFVKETFNINQSKFIFELKSIISYIKYQILK